MPDITAAQPGHHPHAAAPSPPTIRRCEYRPAAGSGAPPPCWLRTAPHRERLNLALFTLRRYGVTTAAAQGDSVAAARRQLDRHQPTGEAQSYLFWTAAEDRAGFADDGTLHGELTVHHSADAAEAVRAALTIAGLAHRPGAEPQSVTILAADADAPPSPW
ncbi:hypothetical protein Dvina_32055 [Dactylosporangium vinaceum]|uniref:Uncharacterized protein n=1 Tax=Dactylosporangium vinaceum TaxID=53362 RepID=A0ABV5MAM6_9ACTN|nr:hypothetical protein [Dactylosporangium vinaceum]UAB92930.1 hypothetical protein Dvina_32055 [Dactylosporangium vinaceum]